MPLDTRLRQGPRGMRFLVSGGILLSSSESGPRCLNRHTPLPYRGTSLTSKRTPLGPDRRPMPRVLGGS
jgi:hypothetical protein